LVKRNNSKGRIKFKLLCYLGFGGARESKKGFKSLNVAQKSGIRSDKRINLRRV